MHPKQYNDRKTEAKRLGISTPTLDRRCKDGQFPFIRLGNRKLFDPELTDRYLAQRAHTGNAAEIASKAA